MTVILIVFSLFLFYFLSQKRVEASPWWNTSWQYRRNIQIQNTANKNLTNYQIFINVSYDSDMQTDFDDLRFTYYNYTDDTETGIGYWIEKKLDSSFAEVWLNVTFISNVTNTTVYMYYGNSLVSSNSDYNSVFWLLNHDMSSGNDTSPYDTCANSYSTLDNWELDCRSGVSKGEGPEKRDDAYSLSGHDGYAYISANAYYCHWRNMYQDFNITNETDFGFKFYTRSPRIYGGSCTVCGLSASCGLDYVRIEFLNSTSGVEGRHYFWHVVGGLSNDQVETYCEDANNNYTQLTGGDTWTLYDFQEIMPPGADKTKITTLKVKTFIYTCSGTAYHRWDDFIVYKYVSPEPIYSVGEEEIIPPPQYSNLSIYPESGVVYQPDQNYQFNATWTDDVAVDEVILEFNGVNYTNSSGELSKDGNVYYKTFTDLPAGSFIYAWYANDTDDNWNSTGSLTYTVNKIPTSVNLLLNGTDGDKTYYYGDVANFTVTVNISGKTVKLDTNFTGWTIQSDITPLYKYTTLNYNRGIYNITGYFEGEQNYSSSSETHYLTLYKLSVTIDLNTTIVWWGEYVNISGIAKIAEQNPISNGNVSITLDGATICPDIPNTDSNGYYDCLFSVPYELGTKTLAVTVTDPSTNRTVTNTTTLEVKVYWGKTESEMERAKNVVCYEAPKLIQAPDGTINKVMTKICVWK